MGKIKRQLTGFQSTVFPSYDPAEVPCLHCHFDRQGTQAHTLKVYCFRSTVRRRINYKIETKSKKRKTSINKLSRLFFLL